jgi:sec-independent protein translocase protein TatC
MSSAAPSTEPRAATGKTAKAPTPGKAPDPRPGFDPESYRMTIGDHLEELRKRLMLALLGFVIVTFICMCFGKKVVYFFCLPLARALDAHHLNPQIYFNGVEEAFAVYIRISLITGAAIAGPWALYQIWQFVAAGLYPHERKYVTRYIPLSITLLITGMVFMYTFVLPITLSFFLMFDIGLELPRPISGSLPAATQPFIVPVLAEDPPHPLPYQLWFDASHGNLKFFVGDTLRVIPFGANTLTTPMITLANYIDMVVNLLLSFGIAFQMPLVVMILARIGIVDIATLKKMRKYVYFGMSIVAAFIIPDVVTGMLALMVPLIGLYEFGIILASIGEKRRKAAEAEESV